MRDTLARVLYSAAWWLLAPVLMFYLIYRGRRQPEYLHHVGERFGVYPSPLSNLPTLWIHAVSVGETRAAEPLVRALAKRYPSLQFVISHTTPTGRATPLSAPAIITRVYLPYDFTFAVRRFLRTFSPVGALFMETEVWPNLVAEGAALQLPMALVNARLSERSARRAHRFARLIVPALSRLSVVLAQASSDCQRLVALGAKNVHVVGNLKFDQEVPEALRLLGSDFKRWWGERRVFLAASTREGEEALLLDAWRADPARGRALLVVVPRHPQRLAEVERLLVEKGWAYQRRSEAIDVPLDCDIVLGDSMGEMQAYYRSATVAYVGGGLLPFGTQNLIEACAVGCPVLLGVHTFNFAEAARQALEAGAALQAADAEQLIRAGLLLMADPERCFQMSKAAIAFAQTHQGATRRSIDALAPLFDTRLGAPDP